MKLTNEQILDLGNFLLTYTEKTIGKVLIEKKYENEFILKLLKELNEREIKEKKYFSAEIKRAIEYEEEKGLEIFNNTIKTIHFDCLITAKSFRDILIELLLS